MEPIKNPVPGQWYFGYLCRCRESLFLQHCGDPYNDKLAGTLPIPCQMSEMRERKHNGPERVDSIARDVTAHTAIGVVPSITRSGNLSTSTTSFPGGIDRFLKDLLVPSCDLFVIHF